ncbi:MAG: SDR family oxidoreductase [Cytophagales bacterium]|nr:SDR family oxidoreductase [Cytophagales bacterium]MDW8383636.1 SDR family oxidoreductase [Flammeovirgaceae bacterium]
MKDKVVIITGGTSGIGKALAFEFGKQGSLIAITGRHPETVDRTVQELKNRNIQAIGIVADVSSLQDNYRMAAQVINQYGKIDILINNAGISMRALFEEVDISVIHTIMNINFFGAVYATKVCLPYIRQTKGSIVGISSIAGFRGLPARTGYSASKFALQGFLEALRTELLPTGVHVLIACPGFTQSNIRKSALLKDGKPQGESPRDESKEMPAEEVAKRIYTATLQRKKLLIMTTQGILTVWLNKFFSGWLDKKVYQALATEKDSPLH